MQKGVAMFYFYIFVAYVINEINTESVDYKIVEYFNSDAVAEFRNIWDKHRKSLENTISSTLQDSFGMEGMNVYIKKNNDKLSRGYFHDDNMVQLILIDLDLEELPRLWKPDISFSLLSNVLKFETHMSTMIVHADYMLLRNKSDIIYEVKQQNASKTSPFLFEQVQTMGKIAISMESCILSGLTMTSLSGHSVNIGHDFLKLTSCQYTVEIYKPGGGSPPVIAKYYPIREGLGLHQLVMQPIYVELIPKLQAIMLSVVNTSGIFESELTNLIDQQDEVLRTTWAYLSQVVRNLNKLAIEKNNGAIQLQNYSFVWDDPVGAEEWNPSKVSLEGMILTGLDTLYSAHTGGPYKTPELHIGDAIRFSSIQIRGQVTLEGVGGKSRKVFAVEILDVDVDVVIDVDTSQVKRDGESKASISLKKVEVKSIRHMSFSVSEEVYAPIEPMAVGYLLVAVPKTIESHLKELFSQAIEDTNGDTADSKTQKYLNDPSSESDPTGLISKGEKTDMEIDLAPNRFGRKHRSKAKANINNTRHREMRHKSKKHEKRTDKRKETSRKTTIRRSTINLKKS